MRTPRRTPASGADTIAPHWYRDLSIRALAGYVSAASGRAYAVALMVNHPEAARATPTLDGCIEWLVKHG